MTKKEFINRVLLIMNEAGMFDAAGNSYLGADTTQVDRHIEGSYVDAWRRCAKVMPRAWFQNESLVSDSTVLTDTATNAGLADTATGTGYIILPDDFYLLTALKMDGWQKAVYEASIENEKTASIQSNEWTRGGTIRPVCTISNRMVVVKIKDDKGVEKDVKVIRQVLNYYSLPKGLDSHTIKEAIYVPVCTALKDVLDGDPLELSEQIMEPLAYLSASTVFTMFEKYDIATALERRAVEMFPGLSKMKGANITINQ
jgi:hypothetical protein